MNAVVADPPPAPTRRRRRTISNAARSCLEGELERWGKWIEEHADYQGYRRSDNIAAWLDGAGGGQKGSVELGEEMPPDVHRTHLRVIKLEDDLLAAVWIKYVAGVNEAGQLVTDDVRALRLGIDRATFTMRLTRARKKLLGIEDES